MSILPQQFTQFILPIYPEAVVIPAAAVQTGQEGSYVYVIGPDNTAEKRVVTGVVEVGTEAAIHDGVKDGDRVVTDGILRLRPGIRVNAKPSSDPGKERTS